MAITNVERNKLPLNAWGTVTFIAATTAEDGVAIDFKGKDHKTVILAQNGGSGTATVTVKAGNGIQGVNDVAEYTIAAGSIAAIRLDSGEFKQVTGTNKGNVVIIPSSTDVKFAVVELA